MRIWVEKHRPKKFSEIKGQKAIVERVEAMVKVKNLQNLMFSGGPGVGKSTLALVVAQELYGEGWQENFLELNASDDRGINVVRETIKDFARTKAIANVPFKIIFLDECDSLTKEAQQALRRTMETYSDNCRFILSCNYSSKIIDPIISRCTVFRFKNLDKDEIKSLIVDVSAKEGLDIKEDVYDVLFDISEGDCRKVHNILQSCSVIDKKISSELIYSIVSVARPKEIKEVLTKAVSGDFVGSRDLLLSTMMKHGLSGLDVIKQIQKEILSLDVDQSRKVSMIEKCGEIEFRMVEGSDDFIQLQALLASFVK